MLIDGVEQETQTEQTQTTQTETPPTQTPAETQTQVQAVAQTQTGTEREWLPEDLRNDPSLEKFRDSGSLGKAYISLQKLIGKKTTELPNENSAPEAWDAFYKQLGRPDSADKYEIKRAEGLPEEVVKSPGVAKFLEKAHGLGLTNSQLNGLFEEYDRQLAENFAQEAAAREARKGETLKELKQMYGADLPATAEQAERTLNVLDPDGKIDRTKLSNNVQVIQLLDLFSKRVTGDVLPNIGQKQSVNDVEDRLDVIRRNPAFGNELDPAHERVMGEYKLLMQKRTALRS